MSLHIEFVGAYQRSYFNQVAHCCNFKKHYKKELNAESFIFEEIGDISSKACNMQAHLLTKDKNYHIKKTRKALKISEH